MDCSLVAGGWTILLSSGSLVNLDDLPDEAYDVDMVAGSLSMQCRFMGHGAFHYSVATHSKNVCEAIASERGGPCRAAFAGLIHDFSEALMHDVVRGIKVGLKSEGSRYVELEKKIQEEFYRRAGLHDFDKYHDEVKEFDNRMFRTEADALFPHHDARLAEIIKDIKPVAGLKIGYVNPSVAKQEIITRYNVYKNLIARGILRS
jgi:hypothetical protein